MVTYSKYNIFSQVKDSENFFIVNILSGNADILPPREAQNIKMISQGIWPEDEELISEMTEKGYLVDPETEKKQYRLKYLDFLDSRDNDEIQLFFVPNYACNFACSYCYQDEYAPEQKQLTTQIIDSFFDYVKEAFAENKKYITLFGGEPLMSSQSQKELIGYFTQKSAEAGIELCVVTNGYNLAAYTDILKQATIREIQVTLDGTALVHDSRRFLKGGKGTFEKITEGIDACLENGFPVNLRMVIDRENINELPKLAEFAENRGWNANPLFKTQIGRNYELHHCQSTPDKLFTRVSLYEQIFELTKQYPVITNFHKPAYSVAKFLSENGDLPEPLFDACPACKTEWAFDYTGSVYSCTATVGKADEKLGVFYPEKFLDREKVSEWQKRDVVAIPQCKTCNLQLACGGGCGSVAKNRNGAVCTPDCRPVKELLEIGFAAYF